MWRKELRRGEARLLLHPGDALLILRVNCLLLSVQPRLVLRSWSNRNDS